MIKTKSNTASTTLLWLLGGLCGAIWGIGLAKTLALVALSPFFLSPGGSLLGAASGIGVAFLLTYLHPQQPRLNINSLLSLTALLLPLLDLLSATQQAWRGPALLSGGLLLAAVMISERKLTYRWGLGLAIGIPLLIYLFDISPYVGRADTFEFQVVAPRLGIAHPSGYPLYILIGKLFSWLPLGSFAWRVNLSSAVFGALAAGMLYITLNDWQTAQHTPATRNTTLLSLMASLLLALSPTLWSRAIEAEVYTLNGFIVSAGLWLALKWHTQDLPPSKAVPLFGLLTGLALASHITLGALLCLAAPLVLATRTRPSWSSVLKAVGLGLAGVALYLYIPLRWPALNNGELMTPAHFFRFVSNAESGGALHPWAFIEDPARWGLVLRLLTMQVGWTGLGLAICGWLALLRRNSALAWGSLGAFGAWIWFNLSFYVADPDYSAFLISGHVILIFWLGAGALAVFTLLQRYAKQAIPLGLTLLALLPLSRFWITGPTLDTRSQGLADEAWARYALQQPLDQNAAILADSEKFPPLYYLQQVEQLRPDLDMVMLFNEAQYRTALENRLTAGQTVYLARYLPGMDLYGVSSAGPLVRVHTTQPLAPSSATPEARFGESVTLNQHTLSHDNGEAAGEHLTLVWQATQPVSQDLEIRLKLIDPADRQNVIWESEATRPVGGYTTSQAWKVGQVITDYQRIQWPDWLQAGSYELNVALFPRFAEEGLPLNSAAHATEQIWHPLEVITIEERHQRRTEHAHNALFAEHLWLLDTNVAGETWAGAPLSFDLTWLRTRGNIDAGLGLQLSWEPLDGTGASVVEPQVLAAQEKGEPATWATRRPTTQRYQSHAPIQPGDYRLEIGWRNAAGQWEPARCAWLGAEQDRCPIGEIRVGPSNAGLANFAQQILLIDTQIDAHGVPAGGPITVGLAWRSLRALDLDYTVFVQVIGPDWTVYGQSDSWPVQGARPTSGWDLGERIDDSHQFYLKGDAPAGTYQVIAGWYLLADMSRLAVINTQGRASGDFYQVGSFEIP